jgi:glycine/D-amino acid oxidase-like deaminating enzyme
MFGPSTDSAPLPAIYRSNAPEAPPTSPLRGEATCDVAVIGGGFTGLSAALHLAEAGTSVLLLEAHQVGWGASGRNFGQVVPYSKNSEARLLKDFGPGYGPRFLDAAAAGPDLVFGLIQRHGISCSAVRHGLIFASHSPEGERGLQTRAAFWQPRGAPVEMLGHVGTAALIGSSTYRSALLDRRGGTINPLAYVRGLQMAAVRLGAVVHTGTPVVAVMPNGGGWRVKTPDGAVVAKQVIAATDTYTEDFAPTIRKSLIPVRAYQIVSKPLSENVRATILPQGHALTDTRRLYSGVRMHPDGRLQVSLDGPTFSARPPFIAKATARVRELFPQIGPIEWDEAWSGWVGMTADHYPQLVKLAPGYFGALGYNGRGIALATTLGRELARHVLGAPETDLALPMTTPRPIAIRALSRPLVSSLIAGYRILDARDERRLAR